MGILCFVLFVVSQVTLNKIVLNTKLVQKIMQEELIKLFKGIGILKGKIICPSGLIEILFILLIKTKDPS